MGIMLHATKRLGLIVLKIVTIEIAIVVTSSSSSNNISNDRKAFFEHSRKMFGDDSIVELV